MYYFLQVRLILKYHMRKLLCIILYFFSYILKNKWRIIMSTVEINAQFIEELKAENKKLKEDHTEFVKLLTETIRYTY